MRPKIKDKKLFYLAIPNRVEKVVTLILKDFDAEPTEAITAFYASPTYQNLEKEETGFWRMPAKKLYEDFLFSTGRA